MTIVWKGPNFDCVSGDTKPTTVPTNTKAYETDTKKTFVFNGTSYDEITTGGATILDALTDVDTTTTPPTNNQVLTYNSSGSIWKPATPPGASGGEANTASNVGTGAGVWKDKTGVQLNFKSIIGGTGLDATGNTNDVTLDIDSTVATLTGNQTLTTKNINPTNNTIPYLNSCTYTIYVDGGNVKARNNKTGAVTSNANLDPLLTTILASGDPSVEIQTGTYNLHSSFAGFTMTNYSKVIMGNGVNINVPQGYTGAVWNLSPAGVDLYYVVIDGGIYSENGSPSNNWDCVRIEPTMVSTTPGTVSECIIRGLRVTKANRGIYLHTTDKTWANDNTFYDIFVDRCKYLIQWLHSGTYTQDQSGTDGNYFENCRMQAQPQLIGSHAQTQGGIIGVVGQWNTFVHCNIWDLASANGSASSLSFSSTSNNNLVIGGLSAYQNLIDNGSANTIIDWSKGFYNKDALVFKGPTYFDNVLTINKTAQAGGENIFSMSVSDASGDSFTLGNSSSTDGVFAPFFDCIQGSTGAAAGYVGLYFNTRIKVENDIVPSNPCNVFAAMTTAGNEITTRAIASFLNKWTECYTFYPSYADFTTKFLKNASIKAVDNNLIGIAQNPLAKRWGTVQAGSGNTVSSVGQFDGLCTILTGVGAGSNTVSYDTSEGKVINYVTTATTGLNAGLISGGTGTMFARRLFGARIVARLKVDSSTTARFYIGVTSATTLPISDTPLAVGDSGIIVGFTAADTNYQIRTNDGSTPVTTTQMTGSAVAKTSVSSFHTIEISWAASGNVTVIWDNGTPQVLNTDLPATTADLYFNCVAQTTAGTARTLTLKSLSLEADK